PASTCTSTPSLHDALPISVGEIISQIQPTPESEVVPSETRVIFEISNGPELVSLNNLKGMTEKEAKDYLEKNNLAMNKEEESSEDRKSTRLNSSHVSISYA